MMRNYKVTIKLPNVAPRTVQRKASHSIDALLAICPFLPSSARVIVRPA